MADEKLFKVAEVAMMINSSIQTINGWYRWKKEHPDHQLAIDFLPDYKRVGNKGTRYWTQQDVWKLKQFKQSIPQGCKGIMGDITQKYVKKKEVKE